jgi:hypothetical protein
MNNIRTVTKNGFEVELIPFNAKTREEQIKWVTDLAAVSYGKKESSNPNKRYESLAKESVNIFTLSPRCPVCGELLKKNKDETISCECGYKLKDKLSFFEMLLFFPELFKVEKGPSRPLEFSPAFLSAVITDEGKKYVVFNIDEFEEITDEQFDHLVKFSTVISHYGKYIFLTSERTVNTIGFDIKDGSFGEGEYFAVRVRAPYFVFAQIRTHGQLSQVAVSDRWAKTEDEIWLPKDIDERFKKINDVLPPDFEVAIQNGEPLWKAMYNYLTVPQAQALLKKMGYKQEIWKRWPNHLMFKEWVMGGYIKNIYGFINLLVQRGAFPEIYEDHTQDETKEVVRAIREVFTKYFKEKENNG